MPHPALHSPSPPGFSPLDHFQLLDHALCCFLRSKHSYPLFLWLTGSQLIFQSQCKLQFLREAFFRPPGRSESLPTPWHTPYSELSLTLLQLLVLSLSSLLSSVRVEAVSVLVIVIILALSTGLDSEKTSNKYCATNVKRRK